MNVQRFFLFRYTIFILLLVPCFSYAIQNSSWRWNRLLLSGLTQEDSKDIQSSFEESDDSSFPSAPNDLLNILQRIESMNNATEPYDAIDDALKAFESEDIEESIFDSGSTLKN